VQGCGKDRRAMRCVTRTLLRLARECHVAAAVNFCTCGCRPMASCSGQYRMLDRSTVRRSERI
jgi:hypothetical protein